jgi:hypothetical protein
VKLTGSRVLGATEFHGELNGLGVAISGALIQLCHEQALRAQLCVDTLDSIGSQALLQIRHKRSGCRRQRRKQEHRREDCAHGARTAERVT